MEKPLVHIYYTGGTIGMIKDEEDEWVPDPDFEKNLPGYLEGEDIPNWDFASIEEPLDSSNMTPKEWLVIAEYIKDKERRNPGKYSGYVILHGTDTMAYTTSALTFMIDNLPVPVVFTGSQIPMSEPNSDGVHNMVGALSFAGSYLVKPVPPHIYLFFHEKLMLGCRTVKIHSSDIDGFDSPNFPPVARMEKNKPVLNEAYMAALPAMKTTGEFTIHDFTGPEVGVLRLFPGISERMAEAFFNTSGLKGVIIHAYGAGNGPSSLSAVFERASVRLFLVACTQCLRGGVFFEYATGLGRYAVSGSDMTIEAATAKLFWLLSKYELPRDREIIKEEMLRNIRGELTPKKGEVIRISGS